MALATLQREGRYRVEALLTTVSGPEEQVAIHGVPRRLIEAQARALGLPLVTVRLPAGAGNAAYEAALAAAVAPHRAQGCSTMAFGDLFLEDIRAFRDALAARLGMQTLYPVWGQGTAAFARAVSDAGFRAVVCSVDLACLDLGFAGRDFDHAFLAALPDAVDPCGENGEFHSFVYDGPNFAAPVPLRRHAAAAHGPFGVCALEPLDPGEPQ